MRIFAEKSSGLAETLRLMAEQLKKGGDNPAEIRLFEHVTDCVFFGSTMIVCVGSPRDARGIAFRDSIEKAIESLNR